MEGGWGDEEGVRGGEEGLSKPQKGVDCHNRQRLMPAGRENAPVLFFWWGFIRLIRRNYPCLSPVEPDSGPKMPIFNPIDGLIEQPIRTGNRVGFGSPLP